MSLRSKAKSRLDAEEKELTLSVLQDLLCCIRDLRKEVSEIRDELDSQPPSLDLDVNDIHELNALCNSAIWYNDECNSAGFNPIITSLIDGQNSSNKEATITCLDLLNKVTYLQDFFSRTHQKTKQILRDS